MIVITGASGFVGRRLAAASRTRFSTSNLLCYVTQGRSDYEEAGKASLRRTRIPYIEADFVSGAGLAKVRGHPEFVVHLAATSATWTRNHRCNDLGTRNFIRSLKGLGTKSHVVFASSIAVIDQRADYRTPVEEQTQAGGLPLSEYGASKLRAEEWLRREARRTGFALSIVRMVTVYGPNARRNTLFPVLKDLILRQSMLAALNWPGRTGLVHVDDACDALLSLAEKPPAPGGCETYFLQTEALSLAEISHVAHRYLGIPYRAVTLPRWFWSGLFRGCTLTLQTSHGLPTRLRGKVWRLRLLADNVFWSDAGKLRAELPDWRPRLLRERIHDAFASDELSG